MSARVGYGQRRLRVTAELIEMMFVDPNYAVRFDLPNDARFVRLWPNDAGDSYFMVFESAEWDELTEGQEIPLLTPQVIHDD